MLIGVLNAKVLGQIEASMETLLACRTLMLPFVVSTQMCPHRCSVPEVLVALWALGGFAQVDAMQMVLKDGFAKECFIAMGAG